MGKKKILIIIRSLKKGGAEKQALILAEQLSKIYKVDLMVHSGEIDQNNKQKLQNINYNVLIVDNQNLFIKFKKIVTAGSYYAVFSYLTSDNVWGAFLKIFNKTEYFFPGVRNCFLPTSKLITNRFISTISDQFVINNFTGKKYLKENGFSDNGITVIHNAINTNIDNLTNKISSSSSINIITVARFVPQKNYLFALEVISDLVEEQDNITYTIVGYGDLQQEIEKKIKDLAIEDKVNLVIDPDDLASQYKSADIYFSASIFEGLSNSIMEAMKFNLAIVASDVGDNAYLVRENVNGFLFPSNDKNIAIEKIRTLLNSPNLLNKFQSKSSEIIKKEFSKKTFKDEYLNLIQENE